MCIVEIYQNWSTKKMAKFREDGHILFYFLGYIIYLIFPVQISMLRYLSTDRKMYYELFDEPNLFI